MLGDEGGGNIEILFPRCPFQRNLLASGGGTADRCIRFWNTATGSCTNTVDTKSQVCSIQWSKHSRELVSSHGFSQNQLIVWNYPTVCFFSYSEVLLAYMMKDQTHQDIPIHQQMTKVAELTGHTSRVLHMATSPDGTTVVSAAGDETLRFWKVFEPRQASEPLCSSPKRSSLFRLEIR